MEPIAIIGTGLAGYGVAREFRKLDRDTPLTIFCEDDGGYYSKPMLSNAFAQDKTAETLLLSTAEQMAAQLRAEIHPHTRITAIDPATRRIRFAQGELNYAKLVLALGADPIRLPLAGDAAEAVLSVNDRADYARFRAAIAGKRRMVILGGGLIGCEFANALITAGYSVAIVDIANHPLGRLVPEPVGLYLRDGLASLGIDWHLAKSVTSIDHADAALRVTLSDGTALTADAVLSAIGLRPRTQLAAAANLKVDRGIATDRWLTTSDPHIYALGDCAEVEGLVLPFVMPLMQSARSLARTLAGEATPVSYPAMPVVVKTPACPLVIAPPAAQASGEWLFEPVSGGLRALYRAGTGGLLGFALVGTATAEKQRLGKQLPPMLA